MSMKDYKRDILPERNKKMILNNLFCFKISKAGFKPADQILTIIVESLPGHLQYNVFYDWNKWLVPGTTYIVESELIPHLMSGTVQSNYNDWYFLSYAEI